MLLTVFTPAYNRADLLLRLYNSLVQQTFSDFEWVIVDDGSSDNTEEVVKEFQAENKITINYFKQENEGKHIAINRGVNLAQGELFFIVDSDDFLPTDSLLKICTRFEIVKDDPFVAGLAGRKGYSLNEYIGSKITYPDMCINAFDFRMKNGIEGDMAEVIRTSIIKKFPFPKIEGEKFCTEAFLWYQVALEYKMLWFSEIIYVAEYLEGGLSSNSFKIRKNAPKFATLFYSRLEKYPIPFSQRLKANINYWRFAKFLDSSFLDKLKNVSLFLTIAGLPLSWIFLIKDK